MAPSSSLISNIFSKPSWSFSSQPILQQHLSLSSSSKSTASMTPGDDSSSSNDNSTMNSSETEPNVVLNEGSLPISKSVVAVAEEETGSVGTTDFVNPDWESLSRAQRLKMAWRRFTDSPKFSALLLSVYVCVDIGVYYINGIASKEHTKQTVLLMQSMISFALGTSVAVARNHTAGVRQIFDVKSWISLFPIAASFAFSMGGQLAAFEHFSAPFVKILGQLKLPLSAVLSTIIIKKEYTFLQWQPSIYENPSSTDTVTAMIMAISMVFSTVISFMVIKSGIPSAASGSLPGLIAIGIWVSFNCLATLLAERVYKANRNVPFYIAQAHMKAGELMTNLAILLLLPSFSMAHFFHGWNRSTIAVLLVLVADSWVSGLVVKRLSSVTKNMSKVASLLALYFLSLRNAAIVGSEILAAVTVVQATLLFVYASQPSQGATTSRGLWTRLYDDPKKENLEKSRGRVVQRLKINLEMYILLLFAMATTESNAFGKFSLCWYASYKSISTPNAATLNPIQNADSKTVKSLEKYLTNMGI
eukprot:jgi/Bigna1/71182/fgenesh1_pg.14_\